MTAEELLGDADFVQKLSALANALPQKKNPVVATTPTKVPDLDALKSTISGGIVSDLDG